MWFIRHPSYRNDRRFLDRPSPANPNAPARLQAPGPDADVVTNLEPGAERIPSTGYGGCYLFPVAAAAVPGWGVFFRPLLTGGGQAANTAGSAPNRILFA